MSTKIWYDKYNIGYDNVDNQWMRSLPLGNGRVAAMVYGNPDTEIIEMNEESLWGGSQLEGTYGITPADLPDIRLLLSEGKFEEAEQACKRSLLANPATVRSYESFGEIKIDYFDKSPVKNYYRDLELSEAVAHVSFDRNDTHISSETFISARYDAFVHRIDSSHPFSCSVTMKREKDAFTAVTSPDTLLLKGQIHYFDETKYGKGGEGMSFGARIFLDTDGELVTQNDRINVEGATYLTVYGAFATNYNVNTYTIDESINYRVRLDEIINGVKDVPYGDVKKAHIEDWQKAFNRVRFELDAEAPKGVPTDYRLEALRFLSSVDPDIYTLYFNFGRYLLLSASGFRATLPANLQGIWCHGFRSPWGSDYHLNINLQMNYWHCENTNMTETFRPFCHMIKMLSVSGRDTARKLFGANGWVHMHTTDIFGKTGTHDSAKCGFFPVAGAWNCLNLWEHYEYTGDEEYLKEIYPIFKGSCEFFNDFLIERDGYLITSPSNSPENEYYYIHPTTNEKKRTMLTEGSTMDTQIIHSLFTHTLWVANKFNDSEEFISMLERVLSKLPPLRVSQYGTVAEWMKDYEEVEPGHRHISHLFGLFPYDMINEGDPVIFEAAKKTIARRLENNGGGTGWSTAWFINFYSRLQDGNNAFAQLDKIVKEFTYYNMFDLHPPRPLFQIDGNFGATSGIAEMLLQSHLGKPNERIIELLPALPGEWKKGSVSGLCARGGFEVGIEWDCSKAISATVKSKRNTLLRIKLNDKTLTAKADKPYTVDNGIMLVDMRAGEIVKLIFD